MSRFALAEHRQPRAGATVRVVLKPPGRGRWAPLVLSCTGKHAHVLGRQLLGTGLLGLAPGQRVELGGVAWRVCEVREE